ncbi:MAG: hypothetical protein NVS9B6_16890 [Candidatus Limnocylindrales bacterium]
MTVADLLLDPRRPYKPLDVGNGIVAGTVSGSGRLLSLGITHPVHGRVVLTDAPAFPEDQRADPAAVRAYRAALADPQRAGAGFSFTSGATEARLRDDRIPVISGAHRGGAWELVTVAPADRSGLVQLARGTGAPPDGGWIGRLRLGRAAYTQLTEGGPLPVPPSRPLISRQGDLVTIDDRALGAAAAWIVRPPVATDAGWIALATFTLATDVATAAAEARGLADDAETLVVATARPPSGPADRAWPVRRAVHYVRDCATTRVGPETVAILADHELLPLVWTRDAYFVCLLLDALGPGDPGRDLVPAFVRWLFTVAERPGGWWPRASLASGQVKDRAFQLDQQLYPVLLAARTSLFTTEARAVLDLLLERRTTFGLIATDETPADDRLAQPYHFSSHVLLWHTLRTIGHPQVEAVRAATLAAFTLNGAFAYAVGGPQGAGARAYHDANDLPTALAPAWGFCAADDPRWQRTIERAWSPANAGFFSSPPGGLGGLGSLHTPHPWPLGDLQRRIIAAATNDAAGLAAADGRLDRVQTWDGLLPEAYDQTGAVASRHWFAWPAALRAWLLLGAPSGG